ncbi:hypothetical protein SAMN05421678_11678 [Actinopolymorpha cephalotaxi]|uniref:Uncharacterized protein n=1 Tax=Actinopolymorpha cephalotaxi TaxID=504797 RepID=A0A1I2ZFP3_9ACTN|nr:hypothetical protein [Actinopolymorpha cephalotaxi]NYH81966.1 hypothetical protein [Actinopolymorpha cephalotaxi]SFH36673.1 hypothetical protein SAMN05421678_11678 [Actinopolymorpha cephalotaxi]
MSGGIEIDRYSDVSSDDRDGSRDGDIEVSALAINVTVPEALRWTDTRRGEEFTLTTLNVRLLPSGHLAAKAYGRPTAGGRGNYVSFAVPDRPDLAKLIAGAGDRAAAMWAAHQGLR